MKLHRFITIFNTKDKHITLTDRVVIYQIKNVLRLEIGSKIILCDTDDNEITVEIMRLSNNILEGWIITTRKNENEPSRYVVLYCAILKRENFELVAQKATEVGIKEIIPLITKLTVKLALKRNRLEKIIKEAAEQSGRGSVPLLHEPMELINAVDTAENNKVNLLFDQSGKSFNNFLDSSHLTPEEKMGIFIGPEGGWTESELAQAKENNCEMVSLGKLTLRAETAAIIGSYLAINTVL